MVVFNNCRSRFVQTKVGIFCAAVARDAHSRLVTATQSRENRCTPTGPKISVGKFSDTYFLHQLFFKNAFIYLI